LGSHGQYFPLFFPCRDPAEEAVGDRILSPARLPTP
jgi:hypothetical protein